MQDETGDLGCERANALVVARLARDVGEEAAEPAGGEAQEAALVRAVEEDLSDRQADELRVGDLRSPPRAAPLGQEIIGKHIKCREQGVEVGRHAASLVSVAIATPDFDAEPEHHSSAVTNSESTI